MSIRDWLRFRLSPLLRRRAVDDDLGRELEAHIELEAAELRESGIAPEEAQYAARRVLGNQVLLKEELREIWQLTSFEGLARDLKYAGRALRQAPAFTVVAILTLALGIGANTAIFSVTEGVLLRPLPFSDPDEIVRIYSTKNGVPFGWPGGPSPMDMRDFARSNHTFDNIVVYDAWRKNVSFADNQVEPEQMRVGLVSGAYFQILNIKPIMGRVFTERESYVGKNYVAAITERLWRTHYGSDKGILGREIRINDEPYTIVAVMPDVIPQWMDDVSNGDRSSIQVWTPFEFADSLGDLWTEAGRTGRGWYSLGRIKPGVSFDQVQADLSAIAAELAAAHPVDRGIGVTLEKLSDTRARNLRPMLWLLMGAVSLILLIACVNLANLLLARNSVRQRELSVRAALGAGRSHLVRHLLAETLLLSVAGGCVGLLLARLGITTIIRIHPDDLPQLASVTMDWPVLIFTVMISLITSLIFGLGPALAAARLNLVDSLKLGPRSGTAGSSAQRMRNFLVVTETAMSLMLLVGAGLLIQSIMRLERQELGIRQGHLLTGHFYLPPVRYSNSEAITRFSDDFADKVRAIPGVLEASVTTIYPPTYDWPQMLEIPGRPASRIQDIPVAQFGLTDAHFLRTLGIPLIRGRDFNASDSATSPPVALISEELIKRDFPGQDPIGQRIHIGPPAFLNIPPGANTTDSSDVTIVGIIADFRNNGLASPPAPQIIVLYSQHPLVNYGFRDMVIRTASNPHLLVPEIARQLHMMDAGLPFAQVQTIDEIVQKQVGSERFTTILLSLFAAVGLALAAVGIYGVMSYLVSRRTPELAVRLAFGASRHDVLWLVLAQALRMAIVGAGIGLLGAYVGRRLVNGLLFGISALDPVTSAAAVVFLLAVAALASAIPAGRAMRIELVEALRQD